MAARLDDKRGEHRGGNSWVHTAAKSSFFLPASAFVCSGRSGGKEGDRLFSLQRPLVEYNISVRCFEAVVGTFRGLQ